MLYYLSFYTSNYVCIFNTVLSKIFGELNKGDKQLDKFIQLTDSQFR